MRFPRSLVWLKRVTWQAERAGSSPRYLVQCRGRCQGQKQLPELASCDYGSPRVSWSPGGDGRGEAGPAPPPDRAFQSPQGRGGE